MIPVLTLEQGGGYQLIKTCTYNQCDDIVTFQGIRAVACVVLSGATPVAEVKESSEELLEHHEIHKRQVVSAASDLSECHDRIL